MTANKAKVTAEVGINLKKFKYTSQKKRWERYSGAWTHHSREQESFSWQDWSPREPEWRRSAEHATSLCFPDPDRRRWHGCRVVLRRVTAGWLNRTSGTGHKISVWPRENRGESASCEPWAAATPRNNTNNLHSNSRGEKTEVMFDTKNALTFTELEPLDFKKL